MPSRVPVSGAGTRPSRPLPRCVAGPRTAGTREPSERGSGGLGRRRRDGTANSVAFLSCKSHPFVLTEQRQMSSGGKHTYASVENLFSSRLLPDDAQKTEVSDLVRTNTIPPDSSYFQSIIASSRYELARYNIDIRTLREALDKLLSERDAFRLHADKCSSLFAPIRSLPPEVLLKIFACCSQPSESDYSFISLARIASQQHMERLAKPQLLRLSRVCSHWHTIIMGTPSLWATIEVNLEQWFLPSMAKGLTGLLTVAVERARTCPLRLKIRATSSRYAAPGMDFLARCSNRWQTVEIDISSRVFEDISFTSGNFPLLEALDIRGDYLDNLDIFQVAPRLREVTLRFEGAVAPPPLPWDQLHTLNYETNSSANLCAFMGLILRCTGLTVVKFLINISVLSLPLALPPVNADLTSLAVTLTNRCSSSAHATETFSEIIGSFTLPSVTELSFRANSPLPLSWPQRRFLALAARSSFRDTVTSLALHGIIITDVELLVCLAHLPRLESLAIADVPKPSADDESTDHIVITDGLLHQLTQTADDANLIPRLHIFRFASLFQFAPQALLDVVSSRVESGRTAVGPFQLEVHWDPDLAAALDPQIIEQLDALRRRGHISYSVEASKASFADKFWLDA
ncbi:hypothetical protein B0H19DRAFT_1233464 [Mycena capillaripes]|nr:hypothetical protein B0H19DRAFT_1233464 [Mycena capillaripes]